MVKRKWQTESIFTKLMGGDVSIFVASGPKLLSRAGPGHPCAVARKSYALRALEEVRYGGESM